MSPRPSTILLTGATGYVGGLLRRRLEERGAPLRCLVRDPDSVEGGGDRTEVRAGDLLDPDSLAPALAGVRAAFYLVHSMGSSGDFEELDRRAARHFAAAARRAGVERIVYLSGLGAGGALSPHLRSRHEVGELLRASGVPVLELRASIVIGPGSLSFEMVRALVERLPVMITPRWVDVEAQPIAIADLLEILVEALDVPLPASRTVEIGGADRASYGEIMREYARQRGLRRRMLRVPVLTPRLSSLWLGLVTPLYARVGRRLVESIRHPTVVEHPEPARELFRVRPVGLRRAIADALESERARPLDLAGLAVPAPRRPPLPGVRVGNRMVDTRSIRVDASPERAFAALDRIGGANGWYAWNGLWRLRGVLDRAVGGCGLRALPRTGPLRPGDALDCWRVESVAAPASLRLHAEMKLPGEAWLQFEVLPDAERPGRAVVRQTAVFDPRGLPGLLYWWLVCPLHALVFGGMLRGIAAAAEREELACRAA